MPSELQGTDLGEIHINAAGHRVIRMPSGWRNACLLDECKRIACIRGLCMDHYTAARKAVASGVVTWEWLIQQGLALPSKNKPISNIN